jgi:hypothetical protein
MTSTNEALHNTSRLRTNTIKRPKNPIINMSQQSLTRFLVLGHLSSLILQCWGYWDPYINRNERFFFFLGPWKNKWGEIGHEVPNGKSIGWEIMGHRELHQEDIILLWYWMLY